MHEVHRSHLTGLLKEEKKKRKKKTEEQEEVVRGGDDIRMGSPAKQMSWPPGDLAQREHPGSGAQEPTPPTALQLAMTRGKKKDRW